MQRASLSLCLAALCWLCAPAPAGAAPWVRVETPAFIIVGDADVKLLQSIAEQFERLRDGLSQIVSDGTTGSATPTLVFAFSQKHVFDRHRPLYQGRPAPVDGFAFSTLEVNYIALPISDREKALRTIFHEYAHVVINTSLPGLPAWLSEGLADYYSTFSLRDNGRRAIVGGHIFEHQQLLMMEGDQRLMPVARLFSIGQTMPASHEASRHEMFYAQSWALVHMLLSTPDRAARLGRFARAVANGTPEEDAWKQEFVAEDIERAHRMYVWQRVYQAKEYPVTGSAELPAEAPVTLGEPEVQALLGSLLFRVGRIDEAEAALAKLSAAAGVDAFVKATLAQIRIAQNRDVEALQLLAGFDPPAIGDWLANYFIALGHDQVIRRGTSPNAETLAVSLGAVGQVLKRRPGLPHALHLQASLLLAGRKELDAAVASIVRARTLAPGREDYVAAHAEVLIYRKEFAAARKMIEPIAVGKGWPVLREWAELALRRIKLAEPE